MYCIYDYREGGLDVLCEKILVDKNWLIVIKLEKESKKSNV